jgi:hypothetical protein
MQKLIPLTTLFLVFAFTAAIAQDKPLSKDEAAIREVIENESKYYWGRNYDKWQALYVHAPYVAWTAASKYGVTRHQGWDDWSKEVKTFFKSSPKPQEYEGVVYKYNYHTRIYGNGAWVSFEQMNDGTKTWETRIMEKQDGKWKIAMVELIFNANETQEADTTQTGQRN